MKGISDLEPIKVFKYFEDICGIPHGSRDMKKISEYCLSFAQKNGLKAIKDEADNVVIYKSGSKGYENSAPIILQGHIDMVCQKQEGVSIDFKNQGITPFVDGKYVRARGTTLGADNGIAVAMIMAILADKNLSHPPIEAVFTTDEEIGMLGAGTLNMSSLNSKQMINLDSEEEDTLTVSCAGGSDFRMELPISKRLVTGTKVLVEIGGLKGGHSGVEIDKGRQNSNILMGRVLGHIEKKIDFDIQSIKGGSKSNAIPRSCVVELVCDAPKALISALTLYGKLLKEEIKAKEEGFVLKIQESEAGEFSVLSDSDKKKIINILNLTPNGVIEMSSEIQNLVETSLNLGILEMNDGEIILNYALRSNKQTALGFLQERLCAFADIFGVGFKISGRYSPWEFKEKSNLRALYSKAYKAKFGEKINISAIHAGLECAVFAKKIKDLDCISIGPDIFGVHTTEEKLSIDSTKRVFEVLCEVLKALK